MIPPEIDALIAPGIQGEERLVIAEKMALLLPEHRVNVIFFDDDGTVYANRPELKNDFITYAAIGGGEYVNNAGMQIYLPDDPRPNSLAGQAACTSSTGPYYRVYSSPGAGMPFFSKRYAYAQSQISLLDNSNITVNDPSKETVYAYMGGWANGGAGIQIDAGFQYDPNSSEQNWALFIKVGSNLQVSDNYDYRYAAGQLANLEFYVPNNGTVVIHASGSYARPWLTGGISGDRTLIGNASGRDKDGLGNVMKRVTSIAQAPQNLSSGSSINGLLWGGVHHRDATAVNIPPRLV